MKKNAFDYVFIVIGLLLLGIGLFLVKSPLKPQGILLPLPYIFIGVGCGVFGHSIGNAISKRVLKNNPEIQKQIEVDKNDERNVTIYNLAKGKAYDIMLFVFGALIFSFGLMGVDMIVILLLVFAYLLVVGSCIYYHCKYNKEM